MDITLVPTVSPLFLLPPSPVGLHLVCLELRDVVHVFLGVDTEQVAPHGEGLGQGVSHDTVTWGWRSGGRSSKDLGQEVSAAMFQTVPHLLVEERASGMVSNSTAER
jgi:hypothetical protein